jgi:LytS/YehU family sensor histidine kinase
LSDFATLIRRNFDAAQKQFIPLENEIENLRLYLQLEKMRFGDKVSYSIILQEEVDADNWMLPTLILQPFVENAVLHGIMPIQENGIITIQFNTEKTTDGKENLLITIADNGVGLIKSAALNAGKKHQSRGMQLIKERLQILSKVTNTNIAFSIKNQYADIVEHPGTMVTISYPEQVYDAYMKINQNYHRKDSV